MLVTYQFCMDVVMSARVFVFFVLVLHMLICKCVTVNEINIPEIISEPKELTPLFISAGLNDIILISAPIIDSTATYYLSDPNGDARELNLNISHSVRDVNDFIITASTDTHNILKCVKGDLKTVIAQVDQFKYKLNNDQNVHDDNDMFKMIDQKNLKFSKKLMSNDFVIGPLDENDHGNWVLSAYYQESDEWVELFQVISIEIIDTIPILPAKPSLNPGEDLYLRFAYSLQNLQSCQIIAPRSTFDRFFDRQSLHEDSCGFYVPNVTRDDEGVWKIIGLGKIVYEANIYLEIKSNVT